MSKRTCVRCHTRLIKNNHLMKVAFTHNLRLTDSEEEAEFDTADDGTLAKLVPF